MLKGSKLSGWCVNVSINLHMPAPQKYLPNIYGWSDHLFHVKTHSKNFNQSLVAFTCMMHIGKTISHHFDIFKDVKPPLE